MKPLRIAAAVSAALIAFALTACGSSGDSPGIVIKPGAGTAASAPATPATDDSQEPASPTFGDTYKFEDGISVSISAPKKFKSSYPEDVKGTSVKMTVKFTNGTSKTVDPTMILISASSGESESEEIFDGDKGLNGGPDTKLKPGKSVKWDIGFDVKSTKDVQVDFTYSAMDSLDQDEVSFTV